MSDLISRDAWAGIGEIVKDAVDSHFARARTPDGKPFEPYSELYAEELKGANEPLRPDNQRTGAFRASFEVEVKADGVEVASRGSPGQMIGWARANALRPVVGLGTKEVDRVMEALGDAIEARLMEIADNG